MSERKVTVSRKLLIERIKENKAKHINEYKEAVKDYQEEANKKIAKLKEDLAAGKTGLTFHMVQPVNSEEEYDKLVIQFEWETNKLVELSISEFNQYVHDDLPFAAMARMSNSTYSKFK